MVFSQGGSSAADKIKRTIVYDSGKVYDTFMRDCYGDYGNRTTIGSNPLTFHFTSELEGTMKVKVKLWYKRPSSIRKQNMQGYIYFSPNGNRYESFTDLLKQNGYSYVYNRDGGYFVPISEEDKEQEIVNCSVEMKVVKGENTVEIDPGAARWNHVGYTAGQITVSCLTWNDETVLAAV